jgi:hypothetical protein
MPTYIYRVVSQLSNSKAFFKSESFNISLEKELRPILQNFYSLKHLKLYAVRLYDFIYLFLGPANAGRLEPLTLG